MGPDGRHGAAWLTVSEEYGGVGLGYLAQAIAVEELSRGSALLACHLARIPICA